MFENAALKRVYTIHVRDSKYRHFRSSKVPNVFERAGGAASRKCLAVQGKKKDDNDAGTLPVDVLHWLANTAGLGGASIAHLALHGAAGAGLVCSRMKWLGALSSSLVHISEFSSSVFVIFVGLKST